MNPLKHYIQHRLDRARKAFEIGETDHARILLTRCMRLAQAPGLKIELALAYEGLAHVAQHDGDDIAVWSYHMEALAIRRKLAQGNSQLGGYVVTSLINLGIFHYNGGQTYQALQQFSQALEAAREYTLPQALLRTCLQIGMIYWRLSLNGCALAWHMMGLDLIESLPANAPNRKQLMAEFQGEIQQTLELLVEDYRGAPGTITAATCQEHLALVQQQAIDVIVEMARTLQRQFTFWMSDALARLIPNIHCDDYVLGSLIQIGLDESRSDPLFTYHLSLLAHYLCTYLSETPEDFAYTWKIDRALCRINVLPQPKPPISIFPIERSTRLRVFSLLISARSNLVNELGIVTRIAAVRSRDELIRLVYHSIDILPEGDFLALAAAVADDRANADLANWIAQIRSTMHSAAFWTQDVDMRTSRRCQGVDAVGCSFNLLGNPALPDIQYVHYSRLLISSEPIPAPAATSSLEKAFFFLDIARMYHARGKDLGIARLYLDESINLANSFRDQAAQSDREIDLLQASEQIYLAAAPLLVRLDRPIEAFNLIQEAKSQLLLYALRKKVRQDTPETILTQERQIDRDIAQIRGDLERPLFYDQDQTGYQPHLRTDFAEAANLQQLHQAEQIKRETLQQKAQELSQEKERLYASLRHTAPAYAALHTAAATFSGTITFLQQSDGRNAPEVAEPGRERDLAAQALADISPEN